MRALTCVLDSSRASYAEIFRWVTCSCRASTSSRSRSDSSPLICFLLPDSACAWQHTAAARRVPPFHRKNLMPGPDRALGPILLRPPMTTAGLPVASPVCPLLVECPGAGVGGVQAEQAAGLGDGERDQVTPGFAGDEG